MPGRPRSVPVRPVGRVAAVMATVVAVALVAGCSDSSTTSSTDKPQDTLAYAIDTLGPRSTTLSLDSDKAMLRFLLGAQGALSPEIDCYLAATIPAFMSETDLAKLTLYDVDRFVNRVVGRADPDIAARARACLSAETITRINSHQPAPDLDLTAVRPLLTEVVTATARALGLTANEAACYAKASWGDVDDALLLRIISGKLTRRERNPGRFLTACLTHDRLARLGRAAQRKLDQAQAEHDRKQAEINAQVSAARTTTP